MGGHKHDEEHSGHDHKHEHKHDHDHDHDHGPPKEEMNINIRAAVVHVIGDMLQSIGVIIAALLITINPAFKVADPICTYLFSILVIFTTIPVFRDCMRILMEVQPNTVDSINLRKDIEKIEEVESVDDLHVWALSGSKNIMTVHIKLTPQNDGEENQI